MCAIIQILRGLVSSVAVACTRRMSTTRKVAPYGSWSSAVTAETFTKGNCKVICQLEATKDGVFWIEQSASTGKKELYFQGPDGNRIRWAPEQSVQNSVHEYGGGSFIPTAEGGIVYATNDGLFEQSTPDAEPVQLADAENKTYRFADLDVTASHVFCVYETHEKKGVDPDNRIVAVDRKTKQQTFVASGADFYAFPRVSPDGKRIVWMQWNHINMPWDETSIHLATLNADGSVTDEVVVKSGVGKQINYYSPSWSPDGSLYIVNDSTNFWNVYKVDLTEGFPEKNVFPIDHEIGFPLWQFTDRYYAANKTSVAMAVDHRLMMRDGDSVRQLATPGYTEFSYVNLTQQGTVYCIANGPTKASTILRIETAASGETTSLSVVREARDAADLAQFDISEPEEIRYSSDGETISGYFYPPKNSAYSAPDGSLPPVLLMGHGGPTAVAYSSLCMKKQFFTTRGFAVFDINYRGSSGFGSKFRHALKRQWGIVDTNDMINGAKALIERGLVDDKRVCIQGSSAGGYLVLSVLQKAPELFRAGVSIYGVADLLGLAKDTHKFERGYNEVLIGKYPEEAAIYQERSPINHIDRLKTPIAFLHGRDDTVVPLEQSVAMYDQLRTKGITTALMVFDGEGHGFRGPEAVCASSEAGYYFLCKAMDIEPSVQSKIEIVNLKSPI